VRSLTLEDIVLLPRAFGKVAGVFLDIIGGFFSWAAGQVMKLLMIVFEVVSPGAAGYIQKTGAALLGILKNPFPFVGNLVKAAKAGFQGFAGRFGTHLKKGLLDWLTGSLPGIYIPKAFSLGELVKFVFSVLGLTWANVRAKLVKAVGETAVKAMETGFDIVVTLVTQGPAAAWDKIKEALGNLQDMVIGGITDLVVDTITKKAIPKLIAMFIPGAGFITAILSIYDTVMVFVNKISKIIQVVTGFINSITAIAAGNVTAAAKKVEDVLSGLLTLAINFLAGFAGLGRVSDKIMGVINKVRAPIDKALDALVNWVVTMAKKLFAKVFGSKDGKDPAARLQLAIDEGLVAVEGIRPADFSVDRANALLAPIKTKHALQALEVTQQGDVWWVRGRVNPTGQKKTQKATAEELRLLDDGALPIDQRRTLLTGVRGLTDGTLVVPTLLDKLRAKTMTAAQALDVLRRISSGRLQGGFRISGGQRPLRIMRGKWVYAMDYYGPFLAGGGMQVGNCQRDGKPGIETPVGWAYVKADPQGTGGSNPVKALAMDFMVPVEIESLGVRGVGAKMIQMAAAFYKTQYEAIVGEWYRLAFYGTGKRPDMSVNMVEYLAARRAGDPPDVAATKTWTYRRVAEIYAPQKVTAKAQENIADINNVQMGENVIALFKPEP
jgi:hypothetical protein